MATHARRKNKDLWSRMHFCWWVDIDITDNASTLGSISGGQKRGGCKSELGKIQSRTFQRYPASLTTDLDGANGGSSLKAEGKRQKNIRSTITLPRSLDLFPEIHGLICIQLLLSSKGWQNILIQPHKICRKVGSVEKKNVNINTIFNNNRCIRTHTHPRTERERQRDDKMS